MPVAVSCQVISEYLWWRVCIEKTIWNSWSILLYYLMEICKSCLPCWMRIFVRVVSPVGWEYIIYIAYQLFNRPNSGRLTYYYTSCVRVVWMSNLIMRPTSRRRSFYDRSASGCQLEYDRRSIGDKLSACSSLLCELEPRSLLARLI